MAQRRVVLPDIGEVILSKRRGSTNMRLSVNAKGEVRLGMPYWAPYEAGLAFINSKKDWVRHHITEQASNPLVNGSRIGKAHLLLIRRGQPRNEIADIRIDATAITVTTSHQQSDLRLQKKLVEACEKALKREAQQLLPMRLKTISTKQGLGYRHLRIRKLTSRWGSCSTQKDISLSFFLMQLPWELIDYVILHELAHTVVPNHGQRFWDFMAQRQPRLIDLRKRLKQYKPRVEPQ